MTKKGGIYHYVPHDSRVEWEAHGWVHAADLGMPHTKAMGDGLFELRLKAAEVIARVFYCALVGQRVVMLHHFIKKTDKTPAKELKVARLRKKEIENA